MEKSIEKEFEYEFEKRIKSFKKGIQIGENSPERKPYLSHILVSGLIGIAIGCLIMWIAHKDSIQHYNICQESQLLYSISRIGDEKSWYVKEDAFGKIKLVQLSNKQIDSLSK